MTPEHREIIFTQLGEYQHATWRLMNSGHLDRVYGALADPTRRAILSALARREITVGTLAERFPISLNSVSKHVKVLEQAGLVRRRVEGREHWLYLEAAPLRGAARWIDRYRRFWEDRLEALERLLLDE